MSKNSRTNVPLFIILGMSLTIVFVFFVFFYHRIFLNVWDLDYHMQLAMRMKVSTPYEMKTVSEHIPVHALTYPVYHNMVWIVAQLMGQNFHLASYIVLSALIVFAVLAYYFLAIQFVGEKSVKNKALVYIISVMAVIFMIVRSPLTGNRFYAMQSAANSFHNPTTLCVRPFGILTSIFFAKMYEKNAAHEKYWNYSVLFALFLLASIISKPVYAYVYMPAFTIVVLIKVICNKKLEKFDWAVGFIMLIAGCVIIAQNVAIARMGAGSMTSLGLCFGGYSHLSPVQVVAVSFATFPVPLILFSKQGIKENIYVRLATIALCVAWLEFFFIENGPSGDFSWGYQLAVQFATVVSLLYSIYMRKINKYRLGTAIILFAYQFVCGIWYIVLLFNGAMTQI